MLTGWTGLSLFFSVFTYYPQKCQPSQILRFSPNRYAVTLLVKGLLCVSVSVSGERVWISWKTVRVLCSLLKKTSRLWPCGTLPALLLSLNGSLLSFSLSASSHLSAVCVCARRQRRFKAPYTSYRLKADSSATRPSPPFPTPPLLLLPSLTWLLIYSGIAAQKRGWGCRG